jgi:VanZ family protein
MTLLVVWLALLPADFAPSGLGWDKLNHAGAIGAATALAYFSLQQRRRAATGAVLYGTSLGILIEILQATLTTGRTAAWGDVAADLFGAGCVWAAIEIYQRKTASKP